MVLFALLSDVVCTITVWACKIGWRSAWWSVLKLKGAAAKTTPPTSESEKEIKELKMRIALLERQQLGDPRHTKEGSGAA